MAKYQVLDKRYKIISTIAKGGFGIIYRAWDMELDRPVAIKAISQELADDAKVVDMFQDEAYHTAKLTHPNIVQVLNFRKTENNSFYIIMEFIEGINVRQVLKRCKELNEKIPIELCAYIAKEVCRALDYAHNKTHLGQRLNIVHRDVTPANIMLSNEGRVLLTDFGIAKAASRISEKTKKGTLKGKFSYMSPEQASGQENLDGRSDLFSLGIVLFEMLFNKELYEDENIARLMLKAAKADYDKRIIKNSDLPKEMQNILLKALEKDLTKRYQTAAEFEDDLTTFLENSQMTRLDRRLNEYLHHLFPDEIESWRFRTIEEGTKGKEDLEVIETKPVSLPPERETPKEEEDVDMMPFNLSKKKTDEEAIGGEKTVFDIAIAQVRGHKKQIIIGGASLGILLLLFIIIDTFSQKTSLGQKLHDILWRPAITIDSVPSNADVFIDNEKKGKTPLVAKELLPGSHHLKITLSGFKPIERSIMVPRKGKMNAIADIQKVEKTNTFIFPFEAPVTLTSFPESAYIYINDRLIPQTTPYKITLKADRDYKIKFELQGFDVLSGCTINILKEPIIEDIRLWEFSSTMNEKENIKEFSLVGRMAKNIYFRSSLSNVEVFVDGKLQKIIQEPGDNVKLTAGKHKIEAKREGFIPFKGEIDVKKNTQEYSVVLNKEMEFYTYDIDDPNKLPISAGVYIKNKPYFTVPRKGYITTAEPLLATFTKDGYESQTIRIPAEQKLVKVGLQKKVEPLVVTVYDMSTGRVLKDASVKYFINGQWYSQLTTADGKVIIKEKCDKIKVIMFGYIEQEIIVIDRKPITVKLQSG